MARIPGPDPRKPVKYCPNCGAEYRLGYERCSDCHLALVDDPAEVAAAAQMRPTVRDRVVVFRSGRRMNAELVRSRLEADGLDARIWSSGLGHWTTVSSLPEITGVASDFGSHQVVVDPADLDRALEVLGEVAPEPQEDQDELVEGEDGTFLESLRKRWMLLAFAIFMLLLVIIAGPVGN